MPEPRRWTLYVCPECGASNANDGVWRWRHSTDPHGDNRMRCHRHGDGAPRAKRITVVREST